MPVRFCLLVPLADGETVRQSLIQSQALNQNFVPTRVGDDLALPIYPEHLREEMEAMYRTEHIDIKQTPASMNPHLRMRDAILPMIQSNEMLFQTVPKKWERLGDLILFPKEAFRGPEWEVVLSEKNDIFQRIAEALNAKRIGRQQPISNDEMRSSQVELLHGDDGWVEVKDNGLVYGFDATKVMYSSGNVTERHRMASLEADDEVIIDAYAGIGYYTMQLLVHTNAKHVHACEINPNSIRGLDWAAKQNDVESRLTIHPQDNLVTLREMEGCADRILLGYLPSSEATWRPAVHALKQLGGTLHIHMNVEEERIDAWEEETIRTCLGYARELNRKWKVQSSRIEKVKWYAPRIRHVVLDVSFCSINSAS